MACYFIASALAAVATLASARHRQSERPELSSFQRPSPGVVIRPDDRMRPDERTPLHHGAPLYPVLVVPKLPGHILPPGPNMPHVTRCPVSNWRRISRDYHFDTYAAEDNPHWYYNCGDVTYLKECRDNKVFDALSRKCVNDSNPGKFKCPFNKENSNGFKYYPHPVFKHQYYVCWNRNVYAQQRKACPEGRIFNRAKGTCIPLFEASFY